MAATKRTNDEIKRKAETAFHKTDDPVEKLRLACLSRGANGIKGLGRSFRIMDDDGNRSLDWREFKKGIHDYGLTELDDASIKQIFTTFDKDGSGTLDFDEFLVNLRPPMPQCRKKLIRQAFSKLDKTGDGVITVEDLKGVYDCRKHPKFMNGEWTEDQVLRQFLDSFDSNDKDGKITSEEFINYYAGVSASIDNNAHFDLIMRTAYGLH